MQLYPKPVTHHHVHRLYHMSLGFCFAFAALAMIGTMATVWLNVDAEDVQVTATVTGVTPGPVEPAGGSSGGSAPPQQTANPTITIIAEPQGQILSRSSQYVFENDKPSFSGISSVPNGLVFVTVRGGADLNSTTRAGADGRWYWQSPISLPNGSYSIRVAVFDSYDLTRSGSAEAYFIVEGSEVAPSPTLPPSTVPPGGTEPPPATPTPGTPGTPGQPQIPPIELPANLLFGVFFNILDNYKYITVGEKVIGQVTLLSNSDQQISNQDVKYKIYDPNGRVVLNTTDTVSFSKKTQFQKTFFTAPRTIPGDYTIEVSSRYQGVTSVASDTFRLILPASSGGTTVVVPPSTAGAARSPVVLWVLMLLLLLLFIVLAILAYRHMRHHTEQLRNQPA